MHTLYIIIIILVYRGRAYRRARLHVRGTSTCVYVSYTAIVIIAIIITIVYTTSCAYTAILLLKRRENTADVTRCFLFYRLLLLLLLDNRCPNPPFLGSSAPRSARYRGRNTARRYATGIPIAKLGGPDRGHKLGSINETSVTHKYIYTHIIMFQR